MRYLLGGYYGMRNVGDDVLLYVTLAEVAAFDHDARFTVASEQPETIPPGVCARMVAGGRRLENVRQMLQHDVWLFGGGGLLQDASPRAVHSLDRLGRAAQLVRLFGRRVALVGVGVGPLHTTEGQRAAQRLLKCADFVTVRDQESRRLATAIAPEVSTLVTGDLAFQLSRHLTPTTAARQEGVRTLGVSLLPYAASIGRDRQADVERVVAMARALQKTLDRHREWRLVLLEFFSGSQEYGDARALRVLKEQLRLGERVRYQPYSGDFRAVHANIAACDAFVGMRFHACLLAHMARVPCLMLAYHPKSESLAARLGLCPDAVASLPVLHDSETLAARIEALLTDSVKFRPSVSLEAMTTESARNFTLLSSWLTGNHKRITGKRSA
jgi:polysaccharide pyruvyl transferase CsaB